MEFYINPVTGEKIPKTISALSIARLQMKEQIKKLEDVVSEIDKDLLVMVDEEGGKYETDNYYISVIRARKKVFDVDKVIVLLKGVTKFIFKNDKGIEEEKSLYTPNAGVIKEYLVQRQENGELTLEELEKYKDSFYEKLNAPFIKIEAKNKVKLKNL